MSKLFSNRLDFALLLTGCWFLLTSCLSHSGEGKGAHFNRAVLAVAPRALGPFPGQQHRTVHPAESSPMSWQSLLTSGSGPSAPWSCCPSWCCGCSQHLSQWEKAAMQLLGLPRGETATAWVHHHPSAFPGCAPQLYHPSAFPAGLPSRGFGPGRAGSIHPAPPTRAGALQQQLASLCA